MSLLDLYEQHLQEQSKPKSLLDLYEQHLKETTPPTPVTQPSTKSLLDQVEESRSTRTLHEEIYAQYVAQHRKHQAQAVEDATKSDIGQIIIPTGTGKTRVQISLHVADMIAKTKQEQTGVYVIGAHRLLLCKQLMDELQDLCIKVGLPINVLYVGSARHDEKHVYDQYFGMGVDKDTYESIYTTVGKDVKKFWEKTKAQGRHLIVVSTYHSFDKLKNIDAIDLCTYDEAHTTIAEDFTENIAEVFPTIKRNYFFTATRKINGEYGGMNEEALYGKVLSSVPPTAMINAGEIVPPRIHTIKLDTDTTGEVVSEKNELMLVKTVIEAFQEHKARLKEDSAHPDQIGAKLLVSAKGSTELNLIQNNLSFQTWCHANSIRVFSYSSEYGNYENFVQEADRNKVYESMRDLKDTDECILLHIDILTEGIDLPSITGVLLLRHLNEAKLFQALGRALRLLKSDRAKLYSGEISPTDRDKFTKPYAYLILPMHLEKMSESSEEMKATIRRVISEYGIPTEEFLPPEEFDGFKEEGLDIVTKRDKKEAQDKLYPLLHVIEDLVIEALKNSGVDKSPEEKYHAIMDLVKTF